MKITLKFLGLDSWDRPVYRDETGTLWKDVDPRRKFAPDLCTSNGNLFDGEPDVPMSYVKIYKVAEIQFVPVRVVWD